MLVLVLVLVLALVPLLLLLLSLTVCASRLATVISHPLYVREALRCGFPVPAPQLGLEQYNELRQHLISDFNTNFDLRGRKSSQPRRAAKYRVVLTMFGPHVAYGLKELVKLAESAGVDLAGWVRPMVYEATPAAPRAAADDVVPVDLTGEDKDDDPGERQGEEPEGDDESGSQNDVEQKPSGAEHPAGTHSLPRL